MKIYLFEYLGILFYISNCFTLYPSNYVTLYLSNNLTLYLTNSSPKPSMSRLFICYWMMLLGPSEVGPSKWENIYEMWARPIFTFSLGLSLSPIPPPTLFMLPILFLSLSVASSPSPSIPIFSSYSMQLSFRLCTMSFLKLVKIISFLTKKDW